MRKFTDKELELAPKVAEVMGHHEWRDGDLYYSNANTAAKGIKPDEPRFGVVFTGRAIYVHTYEEIPGIKRSSSLIDESRARTQHLWLPLEHDCLGWLREKEYYDELEIEIDYTCSPPVSIMAHKYDDYLSSRGAETLLEALYSLIGE